MNAHRQEKSGYSVEELGLGFVRLADNMTLDIIEAWVIHLDELGGSVVVGNKGGVRLTPFGFFRSVGNVDLDSTANGIASTTGCTTSSRAMSTTAPAASLDRRGGRAGGTAAHRRNRPRLYAHLRGHLPLR